MANPTLDRLEAVTAQLEKLAASLTKGGAIRGGGGGADSKLPESAEAWNEYYSDFVQPFVDAAKKLNLANIVRLTEQGWKNIGKLMLVAPTSKKPSPTDLQKFVKPAADAIGEADGIKAKRNKTTGDHDAAYAELVMSLGWVMQPKPMPFIQGQLEAGDFYLQKVLKANKDAANKEDHRAFVRLAKEMLTEMKAYVKQWYRMGVEYKGQGSIFDAPKAGGAAPPAPGAPPAPAAPAAPAAPSAPPAGSISVPAATSSGGASAFGAVLADINKGSGITKGLKKVTADMKTKNRKDRGGLVKASGKSSASGPSKWSQKQAVDKPPSIRKERGNHIIEYQKSGQCRVPEGAQIKEGVFIYKCGEAYVEVPEKVKNVVLDSCKKTRVVINSVVSTVEVVNCQSVTVIFTGLVNSVAVDKTNGCQIWCNKESAEVLEVITSMISEVNVQVPGKTDKDDPIELAVAEQFKTVIKKVNGKPELITESVKHG